jgi:epoxyqueuosine reductase
MGYLASERNLVRREDPRNILPECKSIIVTGTPYLPEGYDDQSGQADLRIASYALGNDYHQVIPARLAELVGFIEHTLGKAVESKIYTDTGPVLERDLAQRAGLGWIGKNTCLINPQQGSYFLLGEILLDVELEPDQAFEMDRCGSCTRCLEACPTECILPDRTIDARRCISYLTIEEKGFIDPGLRADIGNWLFGCDICQQVCPWNTRFAQSTPEPQFQPREFLRNVDLRRFLELKPGSWLQGLRGSPLERPRRKGLVRNAAVVTGNSANENYYEQLSGLLRCDPEPVVRAHAAWALGQLSLPEARAALREAQRLEKDPDVLQEIADAIDADKAASSKI